MPITKDYHILFNNKESKDNRFLVIMTHISEDDEFILDTGKLLTLHRGDQTFNIEARHVYCYGAVDFSNQSDDLNKIANFRFLDNLSFTGVPIYAGYNYNEHVCYSPKPFCQWAETWNPAVIAQYAHGCLDKPERIVLFKVIIR